ncbi:Gfo/Idh/MocA family oxidoreductase [bacterium]|nr:Gfo/Idh/MocA family oxidoreductase [bacterium]
MKQLFLSKGRAIIKDVPVPLLGDKNVLVELRHSFVSTGTEEATRAATGESLLKKAMNKPSEKIATVLEILHEHGVLATYNLVKGKASQLLEAGYSCSGKVVAIGKFVEGIKPGDFVACAGAGYASHGQYAVVPVNLMVKIKDETFLEHASIASIGAIALQGFRRADMRLGESVCIVGLGLIGLITVQLAKAAGCTVVGVDIDKTKLDKAKQFGADVVVDGSVGTSVNDVMFATEHRGVDATIITAASSNGSLIDNAISMTRKKGRVVLVGDVKIDFKRDEFYAKEIDFVISCSLGPGRYDQAYEQGGHDYPYAYVRWTEQRNLELVVRMIEAGSLKVDSLISHRVSFDKAPESFKHLKEKGVLGVTFSYPEARVRERESRDYYVGAVRATAGPVHGSVGVAIVGAGGFSKTKLIPIINKIEGVSVSCVVDKNVAAAINGAQFADSVRFHNDYQAALDDPLVHGVVVATPHSLHAQQAIDALASGKNVFVEKPAATTMEQLDSLRSALTKHSGIYFVDFNRSYSPFVRQVESVTEKRNSPLTINYRVNAGFLPDDHWVQSESQGGRIIGEACHFFELFLKLTNSKPKSLMVSVAGTERRDMRHRDSMSAVLDFEDGSAATLTYVATGNTELGKERMEVFWDGKSAVIDDFYELSGYGLQPSFDGRAMYQDKGHRAILSEFFESVRSGVDRDFNRVNRLLLATEISIIADQLARVGGGMYSFKDLPEKPKKMRTKSDVVVQGECGV